MTFLGCNTHTSNLTDLTLISFLDLDIFTTLAGQIDRARGYDRIERHTVLLGKNGEFVSSDLVHDITVRGNTIGTDRAFIARSLPQVDAHLHYRSVDVSSIKELVRRWFPRIYFNAPAKDGGHRAMADILESIRELDYYRSAGFVAEPGPSSDDAQAVAADIVQKWEPRL